MALSTLTKRAFPYFLVACVGFALAFVVVYFFVLPDPSPEDIALMTPPPQTQHQGEAAPPEVEDIMPDVAPPPLPPDEPPIIPVVPITVPNLVGKDMWDAQQTLERLRLVIILRRDTSSFELPNTVIRQSPPAGQRMFQNDTVYLTISQFPPPR